MGDEGGFDWVVDGASGGVGVFWCGFMDLSSFTLFRLTGLDRKMENVVLNGFRDEESGDVRLIVARLADCGLSK